MKQENIDFMKEVAVLALPAGLQMMIESVVGLIDNIMIGSLGEAAITAVSVSSTFIWLCSTFVMAMASGASIISSQDYGSGNLGRIKQLLSFIILSTLIISGVFSLITFFFPGQILRIYSNVTSIIVPGTAYLKYMAWSFPMMGFSTAVTLMLRSVRSVKIGLYNSMLSCLTNVFFNWLFIFGHLGMPAMGVAGAALGTLLSRIVQMIVTVVYLLFIEKNLQYKIQDFHPAISMDLFKTFVSITIPILVMEVLTNLVSSVQTMITGRISENYISANSITHMAWQLPNTFCWGVGTAAGIITGNSLGNGNLEKAKKDGQRFIYTSVILGAFSAIMVQILLPILLQFYQITEATKILARQMGYMASLAVFFIAFNCILCNGVIKSGGHTKLLLQVDLIGSWFIAIPLGYLAAFVLHWPAYLLYIILRSGNIFKSVWGIIYLRQGKWMRKLS